MLSPYGRRCSGAMRFRWKSVCDARTRWCADPAGGADLVPAPGPGSQSLAGLDDDRHAAEAVLCGVRPHVPQPILLPELDRNLVVDAFQIRDADGSEGPAACHLGQLTHVEADLLIDSNGGGPGIQSGRDREHRYGAAARLIDHVVEGQAAAGVIPV